MTRLLASLLAVSLLLGAPGAAGPPSVTEADADAEAFRVLLFTKTAGFRHASIPDGIEAVKRLGRTHRFDVEATEDAGVFTAASLEGYEVVVFLNTTGDVLDETQQVALQGHVRGGGGFVGVHAATDTEPGWPWYGRLVGAVFESHPAVQDAAIRILDPRHPSTRHLPARWTRRDEWYNFKTPPVSVRVLADLDESSYTGGSMGGSHPIAWCHEFDGGRAWYTAGGHTSESFREEAFLAHVLGGIEWAARVAGETPTTVPAGR